MTNSLGRRVSPDFEHVERYPLRLVSPETAPVVERILQLTPAADRPLRVWYDQGAEGACLPPGTLVRMSDGTSKRIEDVRTLDEVVTAEGNTGRVMRTIVRAYDGEMITIGLRGHRHLRVTPEHPVLVDLFGYTPASDLQIGQAVTLTRYAPSQISTTLVMPPRSRRSPSRALRIGAVNTGGVITQVSTPAETITITPALGRLVGLFLAEGSTTANKVMWAYGGHERDTLVQETVALISEALGAEGRVQQRPNNVYNVVLYGKHWREMFSSLFQRGPYDKALPAVLWSGGPEFLSSVLTGWLAGDGHRRRTHIGGTTVSHNLAMTMYDIAQSLGLRPTIRRSEPANRRTRWDVEIADGHNPHSEQTARAVYRRVDSIERTGYQGFVFNLEVEGDQSYVAEGVGVHNCVGFSCSWMMSILNRGRRYNAHWLYRDAQLRDPWPSTPPDEGTDVRSAFDILREIGHRRMWGGFTLPATLGDGIEANRWALLVDELRTSINLKSPAVLGVNWYTKFDTPIARHNDWWIGADTVGNALSDLGRVRGGHAIVLRGASDKRQAFLLTNSWGVDYPDVWIPYNVVQRLINEEGEAGIVTDR